MGAATRSGQKAVTAAGTAEALGNGRVNGPIHIKALTTNTGLVYVGNDGAGDVSSTTGYPLAAGDTNFLTYIGDLNEIMVDSAVNGEGVAWQCADALE